MLRKILWGMMVAALGVLGCSGNDGNDDQSGQDTDSSATGDSAENEIEIFSWWTSAGEADALQALIDVFTEEYPDQSVVNVSAQLGHGQDARKVLAERIAANDPPDVFQLGPRDLKLWVEYEGNADDPRIESLDFLFSEQGWDKTYPQGVLDVLQYNGHYYAVPVNMHRQNTLFYNTELVSEVPADMDAFMALAADLHDQGIVPVAVSAGTGGWTLEILFFSILSGTAGPAYHDAFFKGELDMTDADNVAKFQTAVDNYETIISYANADAGELGWDQAAALLLDKTAAMYIHGDWAKGYYTSQGWEPGVDFGAAAVPGTEDEFIYNVDAFALTVGAPHREAAVEFLRTIGSAEAQAAFNPIKGSTPVHPDVDVSDWDPVAKATFAHLSSATILHNVETNQFSLPATSAEEDPVGLSTQLLAWFQGDLTKEELVDWVVTNYDAATGN